jgi:dimethylhistidine N-methyltransferase
MTTVLPTQTDTFLADVLAGLRRPQKHLPAKYFYDAPGSWLFDRITELDEYYLTRTELRIMRRDAERMAARCGPRCLLVELGAGSLVKVRLLLDRLHRPAGYVPVDVSGNHLQAAAEALVRDYPNLAVLPVCADFTQDFPLPDVAATRRVVYFPGSTIGNFDPAEVDTLLGRIARLVGRSGGLLLGVDLQKDPRVIEAAYNDRQGVTAAFNRNLLARINRELAADFDLDAFRHRAFYNRAQSRIEMHLVSLSDQRVRIGDAEFRFRAGETIHTENSYKYNLAELNHRATQSGLRMDDVWTDERDYFAVLYFAADC